MPRKATSANIISYDAVHFTTRRDYYNVEDENRYCNVICIPKDTVLFKSEKHDLTKDVDFFMQQNYDDIEDRKLQRQIDELTMIRRSKQRSQFEGLIKDYRNKYPEKFV